MSDASPGREFPLLDRVVHLATASAGPIPSRAIQAMTSAMIGLHSTADAETSRKCEEAPGRCRKLGSRLLGCRKGEIALVYNTTHGVNAFASGMRWHPGDTVVVPDIEYPANVAPWSNLRRLGVRLRIAKTARGESIAESIAKATDGTTRVVAVSHVEFGTGIRNDVATISEIAHKNGALLFVDAAQSLGLLNIRVSKLGIDALSSCGYKWLCGPSGTGVMYVREDLVPHINPAYVGFESVSPELYRRMFDAVARTGWHSPTRYPLSPKANRFEFGSPSEVLFLGLATSMEYLLEVGAHSIESRSRRLVERLISQLQGAGLPVLTPLERSQRAGIVTFLAGPPRRNRALAEKLVREGILVSPRMGGLRASCHFFNRSDHIDCLLDHVTRMLRRSSSQKR